MRSSNLIVLVVLGALAVIACETPFLRAEPAKAKEGESGALPYRSWTSADGAKKQDAAFLKMEDGMVFVKRRDGSVGKIPIGALSPADQLFVGQETASRRAKEKGDDLFTDADDTIHPPDSVPQPALLPREGETTADFAKRYAEHLAKQKTLNPGSQGLPDLSNRLEALGQKLDRTQSTVNPAILATTLSGELLRSNDQRRNAIDRLLSSFRTGEVAAVTARKSAAVRSDVVSEQLRVLEEAQKASDSALIQLHGKLLDKFQRTVTKDSSQEEVEAAQAAMREQYNRRCDAEVVAFTAKRDSAVTVLRDAAKQAADDRAKCLDRIAKSVDGMISEFSSRASPLEEDPRLRGLEPLKDSKGWEAAIREENDGMAKHCHSLGLRLKQEGKTFLDRCGTYYPADPDPARVDAFQKAQVAEFQSRFTEASDRANNYRAQALERLSALHQEKQHSETEVTKPKGFERTSDAQAAGVQRGVSDFAEQAEPLEENSPRQVVDFRGMGADAAARACVQILLGETSDHYQEHGYDGVALGRSFEEINNEQRLENRGTQTGQPFVYEHRDKGAYYIFDAKESLVCFGRRYDGGEEEYRDQIRETFGQAVDGKTKTFDRTQVNSPGPVSFTTVDYTFPKVCVRVLFEEHSLPQGGVRKQTCVYVVDRAWLETILLKAAAARSEAVQWLQKAAALAREGVYEVDLLPAIHGTELKAGQGERKRVLYRDPALEAELKPVWGEHSTAMATSAGVEESVPTRNPAVFFNCVRYSGTRLGAQLKEEPLPDTPFPEIFESAQSVPVLDSWLWTINQLLLEHAFPPLSNKVTRVRMPQGLRVREWLEWQSVDAEANAWKVQCGIDQLMRVEYVGRRRL